MTTTLRNALSLLLVLCCSASARAGDAPKRAVEQVLDRFHQAASKADGATYFGLFAPEGIFIGTDSTERWTVDEFRKYAMPYFSKGKGWTYAVRSRHVDLAPGGKVAWFDEILTSEAYGTCRGSGVLRKVGREWKISQYHLTIPLPNDLAEPVVKMIREHGAKK